MHEFSFGHGTSVKRQDGPPDDRRGSLWVVGDGPTRRARVSSASATPLYSMKQETIKEKESVNWPSRRVEE